MGQWYWGIDQAPSNTGVAVISSKGEIAFTRLIQFSSMDSWKMRQSIIDLYKEKNNYVPGTIQCEHVYKHPFTSINVYKEMVALLVLLEEYFKYHRTSLLFTAPATPSAINYVYELKHRGNPELTRPQEMARVVEEKWGTDYGEHINDAILLADYARLEHKGI